MKRIPKLKKHIRDVKTLIRTDNEIVLTEKQAELFLKLLKKRHNKQRNFIAADPSY